MRVSHSALDGMKSGLPICIGYIPVAITFGAAATSFGYPLYIPLLFSATIFAGGSQFILLAAMQNGTPLLYIVALCAVIDARHLLYGTLVRSIFPARLMLRIPLAMTLTDEVFATALSKRDAPSSSSQTAWLIGVAGVAYLSWVFSTFAGALMGSALDQLAPFVANALDFALPGLFIALSLAQLERWNILPLIWAAIATLAGMAMGSILLALTLSVIAAVAAILVRQRKQEHE